MQDKPARRAEEDKPLAPRARPMQARGRRSIQAIIDAAHRLLRRAGPSGLTTPAIAAEAGVSVGAVYHYFPNKEAVVLALFEQKLADIRAIVDDPVAAPGGDWRAGLGDWIRRLKAREAAIDYDLSMNEALEHYPSLREVSRRHAAAQARIIAGHLRRLGSRWPEDALFDLALHGYFLNAGVWMYWSFAGRPLAQGVDRLAQTAAALFAPAIENAPPPPPPYAAEA